MKRWRSIHRGSADDMKIRLVKLETYELARNREEEYTQKYENSFVQHKSGPAEEVWKAPLTVFPGFQKWVATRGNHLWWTSQTGSTLKEDHSTDDDDDDDDDDDGGGDDDDDDDGGGGDDDDDVGGGDDDDDDDDVGGGGGDDDECALILISCKQCD